MSRTPLHKLRLVTCPLTCPHLVTDTTTALSPHLSPPGHGHQKPGTGSRQCAESLWPCHVTRLMTSSRTPEPRAGLHDNVPVPAHLLPRWRKVRQSRAAQPLCMPSQSGGQLSPDALPSQSGGQLSPYALPSQSGGQLSPDALPSQSEGQLSPYACRPSLGDSSALMHCRPSLGDSSALMHCRPSLGDSSALMHCRPSLRDSSALMHAVPVWGTAQP